MITIGPGAALLPGDAHADEAALLEELRRVAVAAPFRHMVTRGGHAMSVAMTNCGPLGWVSDRRGYRYAPTDPESGAAWPAMPAAFLRLAGAAAGRAGYADFEPDACLINRYEPGAKMGMHQDQDESDFGQPIVSVSLGLNATFLFGGRRRSDPVRKIELSHGDVVVFGGESRLNYHGVQALKPGHHPRLGPVRINLTFRRAA
ncbi:MAG: DNA oxidative demethylase AlkB [Terriglobales bacterium]